MIRFAVVEDSDKEAKTLLTCLERYGLENGIELTGKRYADGNAFLSDKESYDIVFMDIMLPNINGMEVARQLRKYNESVIIIFVTNMTEFAVKSYEVDALDFIVKPISYERVTLKLNKAVKVIQAQNGRTVVVRNQDGVILLSSAEIFYIEVKGHTRTYHTRKGDFSDHGTLGELEEPLKKFNFRRCNACYLVNLQHIRTVNGLDILLENGDKIKISQPKRKAFIGELANWLGQQK